MKKYVHLGGGEWLAGVKRVKEKQMVKIDLSDNHFKVSCIKALGLLS